MATIQSASEFSNSVTPEHPVLQEWERLQQEWKTFLERQQSDDLKTRVQKIQNLISEALRGKLEWTAISEHIEDFRKQLKLTDEIMRFQGQMIEPHIQERKINAGLNDEGERALRTEFNAIMDDPANIPLQESMKRMQELFQKSREEHMTTVKVLQEFQKLQELKDIHIPVSPDSQKMRSILSTKELKKVAIFQEEIEALQSGKSKQTPSEILQKVFEIKKELLETVQKRNSFAATVSKFEQGFSVAEKEYIALQNRPQQTAKGIKILQYLKKFGSLGKQAERLLKISEGMGPLREPFLFLKKRIQLQSQKAISSSVKYIAHLRKNLEETASWKVSQREHHILRVALLQLHKNGIHNPALDREAELYEHNIQTCSLGLKVEDFAQYASAECLSIRHDLVEQGHLKDAKASCANLLRIYDRYEQRSSSADIRSELEPVRHQIQSLQEDIINQTGGSEKKSFQELSLEQKIPVIDRLMQQKRPGVLLPLLLETLTKERRWQRAEKKDMGRKAVEPELEETLDPAHQEIKVPWELSVHFGAASKPWQDLDFTLWAIKENAAVDVSLYGQFLPHEQLKEEIRRRMPGFLPPELHDATEAYIEWFVKAMRARSTAEKWAQVAKRDFQKRKEKEKYVQAA